MRPAQELKMAVKNRIYPECDQRKEEDSSEEIGSVCNAASARRKEGSEESKISEMRPAQEGKKTAENRRCMKCDQRREEMVEEMV
ncbi:hypothetical protein V500_06522 [Pseudogymnoascus sp. VKM F-4518 (FW-2643)]|nr:hypothetical protein V500_06522 [Pseudogymnoascus sp. VKM F-4518 (FW-2643)]